MSIRSLTDLSVKRDATEPGRPVVSTSPGRTAERLQDAVISAIPVEVLALYTALTGGTLALLIRDDPQAYLPYRWALLGFAVLLTPVAVYRISQSKYDAAKDDAGMPESHAVPAWEMASATFAAAAWFLAAPGSPLLAMLSGAVGSLTSGAIVIGAATVLWTVFGKPLTTGNAQLPRHLGTEPHRRPLDRPPEGDVAPHAV
jgi:hypothetical protein